MSGGGNYERVTDLSNGWTLPTVVRTSSVLTVAAVCTTTCVSLLLVRKLVKILCKAEVNQIASPAYETTSASTLSSITASQLHEAASIYRHHGVVVLKEFFKSSEMVDIVKAFHELMNDTRLGPLLPDNPRLQLDNKKDESGPKSIQQEQSRKVLRKIEPFLDLSPALDTLVRYPVQNLVAHILQEPVSLFEDKANCKQANGGSAFPWHQDYFYWRSFSPELLTVFVCVDDATVENGCLQVVTGRPVESVQPAHHSSKSSSSTLCTCMPLLDHFVGPVDGTTAQDNQLDETKLWGQSITIPGKAGSVVVFSSLTPHRSAPNHSPTDRRAIILSFNPSRLGDWYPVKRPTDGGGTQLRALCELYTKGHDDGDPKLLDLARQELSEISHRRIETDT